MNNQDDQQALEQELAQLTPARLSPGQRQRLQNRIAAELAEAPARAAWWTAFHWEPWLAWCGAATAAAVVVISLQLRATPSLTSQMQEQVVSSNSWAEQGQALPEAVSSNIRENQFFNPISFSNRLQLTIPTGFVPNKI